MLFRSDAFEISSPELFAKKLCVEELRTEIEKKVLKNIKYTIDQQIQELKIAEDD